jgi:hypothetical protein
VIEVANSWMMPFLSLFGVEAGNGLSPFAVTINTPSDLLGLLNQFFKAPKRDTRGRTRMDDVVLGEAEDDADSVEDTIRVELGDDDEVEENIGRNEEDNTLPVGVLASHVNEIREAADDEADDDLAVAEEDSSGADTASATVNEEPIFDAGDSVNAFDYFKAMMRCDDIGDIAACALKLVQLVQLGKLEKGALTSDGHFNSRNGRWFGKKKKATSVSVGEEAELFIRRNSLIQLNCMRGKSESVEHYRVLALFSKFYNKWFVASVENFPWKFDVKNARVLARMVKKTGSNYQEVELKEGGDWGPSQIFCVKNYSDILDVDSTLVEM